MKIKNIMLITFLLLAVLTIGAVSASDDIALDNVTASDDADALSVDDEDDPYFDYDIYLDNNLEDICIDPNNENGEYNDETEIAFLDVDTTTPKKIKGSFQVWKENEKLVELNIDLNDDHWNYDNDDEILTGTIFLKDINLTKINDGDILSFKYFDKEKNVIFDSLTVSAKVNINGQYMTLTEKENINIQVNNLNTTDSENNFTYINVTQKEGFFAITNDDEYVIFKENLKTTTRQYTKHTDKDGNSIYCFSFSLTDINNYIKENYDGENTFQDLIKSKIINSGDDLYFGLYEDNELDEEIDSKTMTMNIRPNGMILFRDDDDDTYVEYVNLDVPMDENWQETVILEVTVNKDLKGNIIIYLNDDTLAFNKTLSDISPSDTDEDCKYYSLTLDDLNITTKGTYLVRYYIYDENGALIYPDEDEEYETLNVFSSQSLIVGDVRISVIPTPIAINSDKPLITINKADNMGDEILIYIDGNNTPKTINLSSCEQDYNDNYIINATQLGIGVGEHTIIVSYKGENLTAKVNLTLDLEILIEEDKIIYTTFKDPFVFISLDDGDVLDLKGKINLTIKDIAGNIIDTLEISEFSTNEDGEGIISTKDIGKNLNGTYIIEVSYIENDQTIVQSRGTVTFKEFDSTDYGTSITEIIKNETDYVVTFNNLTSDKNIVVKIDRNETIIPYDSYLEDNFDNKKRVHYIKFDKLGNLADGHHSIEVYIENDRELISLANGTILVDLKENIDPALTVNVANVEEGNDAIVLITTNNTFTGEVQVQVANETYKVNVTNGKGNVTITGLKADKYNATAIFTSNGIFNDSIKTTTFNVTSKPAPVNPKPSNDKKQVKKQIIKLTLKKVKIRKSAKKLVITATLKINGKKVRGKTITFKFKGKTYKKKTNKNGVAKLTIKKKVLKKLKVGKKVTYTAKYSTKKVKKTVKVKK